jgi:hypothetical protein
VRRAGPTFSLFHTRVAPKQALCFEHASQIAIDLKKRSRNTQLRRTRLSDRATAAGVNP